MLSHDVYQRLERLNRERLMPAAPHFAARHSADAEDAAVADRIVETAAAINESATAPLGAVPAPPRDATVGERATAPLGAVPTPPNSVVLPTSPRATGTSSAKPLSPRASARHDPSGVTLAALAPGLVQANRHGVHYVVRHRLVDLWRGAAHYGAAVEARAAAYEPAQPRHEDLSLLAAALPADAVFLDLETCGFAGSPVFLVGLIHHDGRELVLEQLLARTYAEEPAMLSTLAQRLAGRQVLVTFNGKSFDWPMVVDRAIYHRLDATSVPKQVEKCGLKIEDRSRRDVNHRSSILDHPFLHCDLLHHARRKWRTRLPDCRLQTLERFVCRRHRTDDIHGSRIPHEYHHFVRTCDARQIRAILEHNMLDLVTLAELALALL